MAVAAGSRLRPYEVLSPLGAGGMGEVWKARDTRLGREVAIKVLPEALASDRDRLSRFEQEARSASALNHPNIITIYEIGQAEHVSYISMELVAGRTLRELIAEGPLPAKRLLGLAAQIADALAKKSPVWSADGSKVLYRSDRKGVPDIYEIAVSVSLRVEEDSRDGGETARRCITSRRMAS